ncbi:serine hydrolase [Massilia sp. TS11]|uniref:serine hydrolase domain-containing protein n=1 Tax=Massilia sp. TS11 TaxID=2908003 RepID=UPI001EDB8768|nr:serine hydrolase [Massilia sp. TS11]MCG2585164.1 beta-lactamase family protein [Massilia sp. TS11]
MKTTLLALAAACCFGQASASDLDRQLAEIVRTPQMELASLSVVAIRDGEVRYQAAFGAQQIGGAAATPETMYRIASISKMVTTLGALKLVEQGKLDLNTDVSRYLGFSLRNPHFPERAITLRQLLSHTSSLRDAGGYFWPHSTPLASVIGPASWAREQAPGAYFTYSNLNWAMIGAVMEAAGGARFDQLMDQLIFAPMGIRASYHPSNFTPAELSKLATLYRKRTVDTEIWDSRGPWIAQVDDYRQGPPAPPPAITPYRLGSNPTPFSPTGGLRISAPDLARIMLMMMNNGQYQGKQILQPATLARMFQREWTFDGKNGDDEHGFYGAWGLGNQQFDGARVVEGGRFQAVGHLGEAYGLISAFILDREHKDGMVMFVGGTSADPAQYKGRYSALERFTEQILTALYRGAIAR